jgi:hypothetical protein
VARPRTSQRPSSTESSLVRQVRSATSASKRDPTCETTPVPSAVTTTFGRVLVVCTWKVPPDLGDKGPRQALSYLVTRHFLQLGP